MKECPVSPDDVPPHDACSGGVMRLRESGVTIRPLFNSGRWRELL
jgi:hypothetical protein